MIKTKKTLKTIYTSRFFDNLGVSSDGSASLIAPWLIDMFKPISVIDVGCGTGHWLNSFLVHGVKNITGIDGSYVPLDQLQISEAHFIAHDLSERIEIHQEFDLAICLEVAEHLPIGRSETLVRDLCALSPIVVFSAAVPMQGGTGHINEQWPEFWADLFKKEGRLLLDCIRNQFWNHPDVAFHYSQNALVFVTPELLQANVLWKRFLVDDDSPVLSRIHPRKWLHARDIDNIDYFRRVGLKRYLKAFPSMISNYFRRAT